VQLRYSQLHLINFLHRVNYSLCGTVMLYAIFRQRRPCDCSDQQVGSIYGMPSGDATHGAVLGAFLIDSAPFSPVWARVAGLAVLILKATERVLLGWHSIGQVTSGIVIGFTSHFYSTRAPQFMIFVDSAVMAVVGLITVNVDPDLQYSDWDDLNIRSWFTQGLGLLLFNNLLLARHFYLHHHSGNRKAALWASLYHPIHSGSGNATATAVAASVAASSSSSSGSGSAQLSTRTGGGSSPFGDLGVQAFDVTDREKVAEASGASANKPSTASAAALIPASEKHDDDMPTGGDSHEAKRELLQAADWPFYLLAGLLCWLLSLIGYVVEEYATYA